jgi:hypothetical protein
MTMHPLSVAVRLFLWPHRGERICQSSGSETRSCPPVLSKAGRIVSRASQRRRQPSTFLMPIGILGLQLLLSRLDFGAECGHTLNVFILGLVQSLLRLVDGLLPAFALLLPGRLFLGFPRSAHDTTNQAIVSKVL